MREEQHPSGIKAWSKQVQLGKTKEFPRRKSYSRSILLVDLQRLNSKSKAKDQGGTNWLLRKQLVFHLCCSIWYVEKTRGRYGLKAMMQPGVSKTLYFIWHKKIKRFFQPRCNTSRGCIRKIYLAAVTRLKSSEEEPLTKHYSPMWSLGITSTTLQIFNNYLITSLCQA